MTLGDRAKDRISGFEGIITGRCEYITGCNQVLLTPALGSDGTYKDPHWFDEQRVDVVEAGVVTLDNGKNPGCDIAAPIR